MTSWQTRDAMTERQRKNEISGVGVHKILTLFRLPSLKRGIKTEGHTMESLILNYYLETWMRPLNPQETDPVSVIE